MEGFETFWKYRGYDSAGIAVHDGKNISLFRSVGTIVELERKIGELVVPEHPALPTPDGQPTGNRMKRTPTLTGIKPKMFFLIHNGIVENFYSLKKKLEKSGVSFRSDTDTEVLAHLIALHYDGNLGEAVRKTMSRSRGPSVLP